MNRRCAPAVGSADIIFAFGHLQTVQKANNWHWYPYSAA